MPGYTAAFVRLTPTVEHERLSDQFHLKGQDYESHQERIFGKFVQMIQELVARKCEGIPRMRWDAAAATSSTASGSAGTLMGGPLTRFQSFFLLYFILYHCVASVSECSDSSFICIVCFVLFQTQGRHCHHQAI